MKKVLLILLMIAFIICCCFAMWKLSEMTVEKINDLRSPVVEIK